MCRRPSRSLNITVTALIRFSSVRYLMRSSRILSSGTRLSRCSLACRFSSSSSPYESRRKSCSSLVILLLGTVYHRFAFRAKSTLSTKRSSGGKVWLINCVYGADSEESNSGQSRETGGRLQIVSRPPLEGMNLTGSHLHLRSGGGAELLQQREEVPVHYLLNDLLILSAVDGSAAYGSGLAGGRDPQELAFVGAAGGPVNDNFVAFGNQIVEAETKIRERIAAHCDVSFEALDARPQRGEDGVAITAVLGNILVHTFGLSLIPAFFVKTARKLLISIENVFIFHGEGPFLVELPEPADTHASTAVPIKGIYSGERGA